MKYGYMLKLSNRTLYKEIQLPVDAQKIKIGMEIDCDVRLYRDRFFEAFDITLMRRNGNWQIFCSENIYIDDGDVQKVISKAIVHGDRFTLRYRKSDQELLHVEFLYDFDNAEKNYNRVIELAGIEGLQIGGTEDSQIRLNSPYVKEDSIVLRRHADGLALSIRHTAYGVYINGYRSEQHAMIADGDFFSIADFSFYYKNNKLYTDGSDRVRVRGLNEMIGHQDPDYPNFKRNTRIRYRLNEDPIDVLDPPDKIEKQKNNIIIRLIPSLGMIAAAVVMASMGGRMILFSAISGGLAVVAAIAGMISNNKEFKRKTAERQVKYRDYIARKRREIEASREEEREVLEKIYVSPETSMERLDVFSPDLFDRVPEDEDFLTVRLGLGNLPAKRIIRYKEQERLDIEDDLQEIPEKLFEEYEDVLRAPVTLDLKAINALGIYGPAAHRDSLLKSIIIDIVTRQHPKDTMMFFVGEEENRNKIHWLRLLPQTYNPVLGVRNMVLNEESRNLIFEYLYKEFSIRSEVERSAPHLLIFFYDEFGFKNHPISKFTEQAKELNATFIFMGDRKADIPPGCDQLLEVRDGEYALQLQTDDVENVQDFSYDAIEHRRAMRIAQLLAPVYTEEVSLEGTLTKNISLFKLFGIMTVDDLDLSKRWGESRVFRSMAAPLGVSKSGTVYLDLHDKHHGPHGLVAGTTGSGKSEILQSYILSMATLFHPYEVGFVIIDFKGGGMVNQFRDLPHLLGSITNIDGKEIDRSLKSIKAELEKRQHLFAEADVNHIDKYIQKYRAGEVKVALPHLILIVDEFAELKAEQPEFMKELISAARIGRSLGVHLILATQKPSGQVNEQIWSNSRFKLCLKVQSAQDSNEVLKSPLAAEIKEPGRAYLQVGNNEIFELFQSAYSGAPEKADDSEVKEFTIYELTDSARRVPIFEQKKNRKEKENERTQLDAIVDYVNRYCRREQIEPLSQICLPSLAEVIAYPEISEPDTPKITVPVALYDDPDHQLQDEHVLNLTEENVMLIGSAQTGKTNVLQNIIRGVATRYSPDQVSMYIIDFASMVLKNFEKLHHVGGVVCPTEDEKLTNLFRLLRAEMETRKEKLIETGVSSFAAYLEAGGTDLPQILLLIDNMTVLKELYFQENDELLEICREGLSVGISVVIANAQTAGIGYKYLSNFAERIALFNNDINEYHNLFDHCRERIEEIPGRALVRKEGEHLEAQMYLAFEGELEIERVKAINEFVNLMNARYPDTMAQPIPVIPGLITRNFVLDHYGSVMTRPFELMVGMNYANVSPTVIDFADTPLLAVSGREGAGRHNFVRYVLHMLAELNDGKISVHVLDDIRKRFADLKSMPELAYYSLIPDDAIKIIFGIADMLETRYQALAEGDDAFLEDSELLVFVIDHPDALTAISENREAFAAFKNIVKRYRNLRVLLLVSAIENVNIPYGAPEIYKYIRDHRHFVFFEDMGNMKLFDPPLPVIRRYKKPIELGDGYLIRDNEYIKLKTPLYTGGAETDVTAN